MFLRPLTVFSILSTFLLGFGFLSALLPTETLTIIDSSFGNFMFRGNSYPLHLGIFSLRLLTLLAALFIYLFSCELFGSKAAFAAGVSSIVGIWFLTLTLGLTNKIQVNDLLPMVATSLVFFVIFGLAGFIFFIFRKILRNHWLLIRTVLAGVIGCMGISTTEVLVKWSPEKTTDALMALGINYSVQAGILFIASLIFFYSILLILRGLVGKVHLENIHKQFSKKKLIVPNIKKDFFEQKIELQERRLTPAIKIDEDNGIPS